MSIRAREKVELPGSAARIRSFAEGCSPLSLSAHRVAPSLRTSIWASLETELDAWAAAGRTARFWWRDDDAIQPSAALDRLLVLAGTAPLALAVIPDRATGELARRIANIDQVTVLQHGIAHRNHAPPAAKKAELGAGRPPATLARALAAARRRLEALFGAQFRPVLVPPWNRIADDLIPLLSHAGFIGLSTAGPCPAGGAPGLRQVNSHIDPIDWRGTRQCRPTDELVAETVRRLAERRLDPATDTGPLGLLTHHLLDDGAAERFAADFASLVRTHPAAAWTSAQEIWPA